MALFGDTPAKSPPAGTPSDDSSDLHAFGPKAKRWMRQENVTLEELNEVFHVDDAGAVELIATTIPGNTVRDRAGNVYLLSGIRSLLRSDEPTVENAAAVAYCKHFACYDSKNHAKYRSALGNKLAGNVASGFVLPAPGLKAAAAIIKQIAKPGNE